MTGGDGIYFDTKRQKWHGQIKLPNGKRRSVYGEKRRDVQRKLAELRREVDAGLHDSLDGMNTRRAYLDGWLLNRRASLRTRSYQEYARLVKLHLGDLGSKPLSKLTPKDLHDLYTAKLAEGLSSTRVNMLHVVLHMALKAAVRMDILPRNVADFVDAPTAKHQEFVPLTEYEVWRFLFEAKEDRLGALYLLALATGMRAGEYLGLQWQNVQPLPGIRAGAYSASSLL
jgi:integrase